MNLKFKPALVLFLLFFSSPAVLEAQISFKGKSTISAGYGISNLARRIYIPYAEETDYKDKSRGPMHLKYEYQFSENSGIALSINSVRFSATFSKIVNDSFTNIIPTDYSLKSNCNSFIVRYNFHFLQDATFDGYVGAGIGYRGGKTKVVSTPFDSRFIAPKKFFPIGIEATIGMRYFFSEKFGFYGEAGVAMSMFQLGLSYKIN